MPECRFQRASWEIEFSRQRIDRHDNISVLFYHIADRAKLLVSKSDCLGNRGFSEEFANGSRDARLPEAWSDDFEWYCGPRGRCLQSNCP
jgi:hypothetical protein